MCPYILKTTNRQEQIWTHPATFTVSAGVSGESADPGDSDECGESGESSDFGESIKSGDRGESGDSGGNC